MPQLPTTPVVRKSCSTNPPPSAPARSHSTSSRLERLAAPRPSSSWKKPIKSKFQRRHTQLTCSSSSWEELVKRSKRLSEGQEKIDRDLGSLHDRIERHLTRESKGEKAIFQDDWNDYYSVSGSDSESIARKSQDERIHSLEKQIDELNKLLAARDKSIVELEARPKGQAHKLQDSLAANNTLASSPITNASASAKTCTYGQTDTRMSLDSIGRQGSFNDLFNKLSVELDSQLSEINQMSTDHEARIGIIQTTAYDPEMFETEAQVTDSGDGLRSSKVLKTNNTAAAIHAKVEMLSLSLAKIKEEHQNLISDYHTGCKEFKAAFDKNCVKIMDYVREELESDHFPVKNLKSYNEALQYELEVTRWENAELKSELQQRRKDERDVTIALVNTPDKKELEHLVILSPIKSPLPTIESWTQFCTRFHEAIAGGKNAITQKKKLDDNAMERADRLFKELSFAKDSTPFQKRNACFCDKDICIDAVS